MYISIYQIDMERDTDNLAFMNMERTARTQGTSNINSSIYNKVFEGAVSANNLEDVYYIFNLAHPEEYTGRSLSVSDVVQVVEDNPFGSRFYFCDSYGFKPVEFDTDKVHDPKREGILKGDHIELWGRLGISLNVTPQEVEALNKGGLSAQNLLLDLIKSERCMINGDTYFPEAANEYVLKEDLGFDLPCTSLYSKENKKPSLDAQIQASLSRTSSFTPKEQKEWGR